MNIIIHRGTHQIGGSCIELSTQKSRIILDIGRELPNIDEKQDNKEQMIPKIKGLYRDDDNKTIDAIIVSHGHGDHVGLIEYVNQDIPIFIGEKALKILNVTSQFIGKKFVENPVHYYISCKEFVIGDFSITPYLVDHSGFDAYAFVIKADNKCVVYTGDFRNHGRKKNATEYFIRNIPNKVDVLLIEGTMMSRKDEIIKDEEELENEVYNFMKSNHTPMFVLQSATNIDRLVSVYRASKRSGRIFVMDIFTANIVNKLNDSIPKPGLFKGVRVFYPKYLTNRMFKEPKGAELMNQFSKYKISREELAERNDYCMLVRNSMLTDLIGIKNIEESGFIYSLWNGYKKEEKTKAMLDYVQSKNMKIVDIHTSGHASMDTIERVIENSKAKKIIPIHTEKPEMFSEKFKNVCVTTDGEIIGV